MRRIAALVFITLGHAATAEAYSFAPAGASFVTTGKMAVSTGAVSANCNVRFVAHSDAAGDGHITQAVFSGGPFGACGGIRALGLPWTMRAAGPGKAVIAVVSIHFSLSGDCSARDVPVSLGPGGAVGFPHVPLPPKCAMNGGSAATKPPLRVVP